MQVTQLAASHAQRGSLLKSQGKLYEAIECFFHAVQLEPQWAQGQLLLGYSLHELSQRTDVGDDVLTPCINAYRAGLALDPHNSEAHVLHSNLGLVLHSAGRCVEALASFDNSLRLNPEHAEALYHTGHAHAAMGNFEAAGRAYRASIRLARATGGGTSLMIAKAYLRICAITKYDPVAGTGCSRTRARGRCHGRGRRGKGKCLVCWRRWRPAAVAGLTGRSGSAEEEGRPLRPRPPARCQVQEERQERRRRRKQKQAATRMQSC